MRRELAGIHHAEETFAVHDFADQGLCAERRGRQWGSRRRSFLCCLNPLCLRLDHCLVVAINERAFERDGFAVQRADGFAV